MTRHRFGWSGRKGIDRCRCGLLRALRDYKPYPFWWYWAEAGSLVLKLRPRCTSYSGRALGDEPCPARSA